MLKLRYMVCFVILYVIQYIVFFAIDKEGIDKHHKKIKLNKYTNKLFFLWNRREKIYFGVYIMVILESIVLILLWIFYFLKNENFFKIMIYVDIYTYVCGLVLLGIKTLIKDIKDSKRRR